MSEDAEARDQRKPACSDSSDGSDTDLGEDTEETLLAGLRDGVWLDAQQFPPLRYAVEGLLPEGFSLLIGPPKAGKSWLVLDILLAVAAGGYAAGKVATGEKRRVLYLALEDGDRRMQDRCRTILAGAPIPERFHYITEVRPDMVLMTIAAFLHRYPDTALVVIDTLGKVMPPAAMGESAYQRDYRVAGTLKRLADSRPGMAITALHHDRKASSEDFVDSVSGTHGLAGAADTVVVLVRKRQAQDAVLKVTGRDVPEAEYAMRMADGVWVLDGADLGEAAARVQQRAEADELGEKSVSILEFVRRHPEGARAKAVAEQFGDDAHQYLKRLLDSGRLSKPVRGVYVAPDRHHEELTDVGPGQRALCAVCGESMTVYEPNQTTHPGCST
ncbi:AAA family ATPase [Streptomyces orinoci]|uniref:AAA family ATPase n=1 Tax=Streptomyces orinoci TaxID=67339 RepID=A0ABV3JUD7_STRON|nr:AAA family ATPase [Streptomyces orinoci]